MFQLLNVRNTAAELRSKANQVWFELHPLSDTLPPSASASLKEMKRVADSMIESR
jgi:hypothetical protein